jgi:hypothetical protein
MGTAPLSEIRKFSLVYDIAEDRLAFDTEDNQGATTRLWLTQRFCRGFVTALLPMLPTAVPEAAAAPERQAVVQSWEQAAAMADFGKVEGVKPQPQAASGLVNTVQIRPMGDRLDLAFDYGAGQALTVGVPHTGVRQMLTVMRRLYAAAGWPLDIWPAWIDGPADAPSDSAVN